jgi:hypothetical protein
MNPETIDNLIDNLDPDYKELLFGEFFETIVEIFTKDLGIAEDKVEDVSYVLMLYFIFILSKYQLIETISSQMNIPIPEVSATVFRMIDNLTPDLMTSIEATYRTGLTDPEASRQFDYLQTLNQEQLVMHLAKTASAITPTPLENVPASHTASRYQENTGDLNITDEIAEVEKEMETLRGLRTMSNDMHVVQPKPEIIHTASSQADILARPSINPTNTPSDTPRWETQQ